ncbi:MAG: helical backbone metal receptor [Pseudomonadota bacterium]
MGRSVQVPARPHRLVSLVPSQTELLFSLGLQDRLAGLTRYCLHPEQARSQVSVIGGTKRIKPEKVAAVQPDLIIGNKEENDRESIAALEGSCATWMSDIETFADALDMIRCVGELTQTDAAARELVAHIQAAWKDLPDAGGQSVAYLIWQKPHMAVGSQTFIHSVFEQLNLRNVFADRPRYPEITLEELRERKPDWVLLSSEPFPFTDRHVDEFREALPGSSTTLVDGEMFSWYGSRLALAPDYFHELLPTLLRRAA